MRRLLAQADLPLLDLSARARREPLRLPAHRDFTIVVRLIDVVLGVLLRAFQVRLAPQAAALLVHPALVPGPARHSTPLLAGPLRLLALPLRLLTRPLRLNRPLRLTRPLLLARSLLPGLRLLLTRSRLLARLALLPWPLLLLARLVLLARRRPLHVRVLALFAELAFLAAGTTAVQTFLVLGHGDASFPENVIAAEVRHKLRAVVGTPCRCSCERLRPRLC